MCRTHIPNKHLETVKRLHEAKQRRTDLFRVPALAEWRPRMILAAPPSKPEELGGPRQAGKHGLGAMALISNHKKNIYK